MSPTKKDIISFIKTYRCLPSLWDKNNLDYNNEEIKAIAYDILIEKMKNFDPNATQESVDKKIKNIISYFLKSWKKLEEAKATGDAENVKKPYYYNELLFLVGQEKLEELQQHAPDPQTPVASPSNAAPTKKKKETLIAEMRINKVILEAQMEMLDVSDVQIYPPCSPPCNDCPNCYFSIKPSD